MGLFPMPDPSDFLRELEDDLRQDRWHDFWIRSRLYIFLAAGLILLASGGWHMYMLHQTQKQEELALRYEQALQKIRANELAQAEKDFSDLSHSGSVGYSLLARFQWARQKALTDPRAAIQLYDALNADSSLPLFAQDLAQLQASLLALEIEPPENIFKRLEPLSQPNRPFRSTALEIQGLLSLKQGETQRASQAFDQIIQDLQAPPTLRERVEAFQSLIPIAAPARPPTLSPAPEVPPDSSSLTPSVPSASQP